MSNRLRLGGAGVAAIDGCVLAVTVAVAVALALAAGFPTTARASSPHLSVRSAALIEMSTGQRLYGSDADEPVPIASATKLMTALITLEHVHHLGTVFTQPVGICCW